MKVVLRRVAPLNSVSKVVFSCFVSFSMQIILCKKKKKKKEKGKGVGSAFAVLMFVVKSAEL